MPELAAQQPDLAGVHHFMMGAPQQRLQFRLRQRMGMADGLVQLAFVQARQLAQHLFVHPVEDRADVGRAGVPGA